MYKVVDVNVGYRDFVNYTKCVLLCEDVNDKKYYTMTVMTITTMSREDSRRMKARREREQETRMYCTPIIPRLHNLPLIPVTPPEDGTLGASEQMGVIFQN